MIWSAVKAVECAKHLGITVGAFHHAKYRSEEGTNKRHMIETLDDDALCEEPLGLSGSDLAAIQAWDAFCEPLRKKFGIPIRPLRQEAKRNGK